MEGITHLRDNQDRPKAVQIDAERYGDVLQDFLDGLEAESLKQEPTADFDAVAKRIMAKQTDDLFCQ